MDINAPLTPDELRQLDTLMEAQGGMRLSKLHGYLTAVISGPELMHPDSWLPWVWGGSEDVIQHPQFSISMEGVRRLYNTIREHLEEEKPVYPLFSPSEMFSDEGLSERLALVEWCRGYMEGVDLMADIWLLPEHHKAQVLLVPIVLASDDDEIAEDYLGVWVTEDDLEEARLASFKHLSTVIPAIDAYWTLATNRQRYTIRVANHRLCACGSGKEFETCCGQRTLH